MTLSLTARLTPAELRVLEAMRTADNERDAARRLGLSPWTVANHLRNVRAKCGVRTTRQALEALVRIGDTI